MNFLSDFGIQPVLLAAQVVNFLILLFILKKFLYKPILRVLETRKKRIEEGLKNAEEIEKRLAATEDERNKTLDKASGEAKKIIDEATKSGSEIIAAANDKAQKDMEEITLRAQEQIGLDREKMRQEMKGEVANLVANGLEIVAGKVLNNKDKKDILDKSLKNIS